MPLRLVSKFRALCILNAVNLKHQTLGPAQRRAPAIGGRVFEKARIGKAARKRKESRLCFEPREGGADAIMRPGAKAKMLVLSPLWIEASGKGKAVWIAICGRKQKNETRPFWDRHARNFNRRQGLAGAEMDGRVEPQYFIDEARGERFVVPQPLQPFGIAQERQHAIGDEIYRGLVTRDQKKRGGREQIVAAHFPMLFVFERGKVG